MNPEEYYDVAIVGGGLAGLAAAIELRKAGHSVIVFEKEKYPFHKVCGEYISLESWNFLISLGIPLMDLQVPHINTLFLSAPNGISLTTKLPLGGFGISRFTLDELLADKARENGIYIAEETKVQKVVFDDLFSLQFHSSALPLKNIKAKVCLGAFGKHSNLDVQWNRNFLTARDKKLDNFIGIKYHLVSDWPQHMIGLHNFNNGYCGISKIEHQKYCLCYMTTSTELKKAGNSISQLQETLLFKNPHLKKIFRNGTILQEFPVTISQINFNRKTQVENHILMLGDAGGLIAPLCGNGMSIALRTGKIAAFVAHDFLLHKITRNAMEQAYTLQWKKLFSNRLRNGRILQHFFGNTTTSNLFVGAFKTFPFLARPVIRMTHGDPF